MTEEDGQPTAVFTGGALMLSGGASVELLGDRVARFLARWLHNTIHQKLFKMPDDFKAYPAHSGGSSCSAGAAYSQTLPSTIAQERSSNPFSAHTEEQDFVTFAVTRLGSYPSYYRYPADINRR